MCPSSEYLIDYLNEGKVGAMLPIDRLKLPGRAATLAILLLFGPATTANRLRPVLVPSSYRHMPDTEPKRSAELISYYAGPEWTPWAYCQAEHTCGHNARIDIAAVVAKTGDMPADQFRRRLRCSRCGGRARLVIGHR